MKPRSYFTKGGIRVTREIRNRDYQPPQLTPRAFARLHSHWADGDAERHHDVHQPALAPHALNVGHDTHIMMQMQ